MSNNTRQKLEQGRAQKAYDAVKGFVDDHKGSSDLDEYKSYSKKFPMMVKTNGLGPALAFIKSKRKKAYEQIYSDITNWLKDDFKNLVNLSETDLLEAVVSIEDSANYRAITNEVLAFMNWHRRFAEGMIGK
jgi:CRISPR-associated protein Cmr5